MALSAAEDAAASDEEVGAIAALRSHDDGVAAAERHVVRCAHLAPEQVVRAEGRRPHGMLSSLRSYWEPGRRIFWTAY